MSTFLDDDSSSSSGSGSGHQSQHDATSSNQMAHIQSYLEAQTQHFHEQLALSQAAQREQLQQQFNAFAAQFAIAPVSATSSTSSAAQAPTASTSSAASVAASSGTGTGVPMFNPILTTGPLTSFNPLPSKVKIAAPSTFTGHNDGINVEIWLFEMVQYLDTTGVADNQRINVVRNYLKNGASTWWVSLCKANKQPRTWNEFVESIKLRFQPIEAGRIARAQLRSVSQNQLPVTEYINKFQSILNSIPDMADADQVQYFLDGLQLGIQREVAMHDPKTLQEAMIKAQKLDVLNHVQPRGARGRFNNYDYSASSSSSSSQSGAGYGSDSSSYRFNPSSSSSSSSCSSSASAPMELGNVNISTAEMEEGDAADAPYYEAEYERYLMEGDDYDAESSEINAALQEGVSTVQLQTMQQSRPHNPNRAPYLSREEFTRCMNQGLCLRCKKPGHVSRNCELPREPRQSNPQHRYSRFQSRVNYQNSRRGLFQPARRNFE
jgi:hypothetical protein